MFPFIFLLTMAASLTLSFDDATINLNLLSSGSINFTNPSQDACGKIIARNSSVHHLSIDSVYQNWMKGNLLTNSSLLVSLNPILDYAVDQGESLMTILYSNGISSSYNMDGLLQIALTTSSMAGLEAKKIVSDGVNLYVMIHASSPPHNLMRQVIIGGAQSYQSVSTYQNIVLSPDNSKLLIWTNLSNVQLVNTAVSLNIINTFTPNITPTAAGCTKTITFSQDSSLAIVEMDTHNPIAILNTTDLSVVHTIEVFESIQSAHFINSSNFFVIIFGVSTTFLVDLEASRQYQLNYIAATSYTTDLDNNIFFCVQNTISQLGFSYTRLSSSDSSDSNQFRRDITLSGTSEEVYELISKSLTLTTNATQLLSTFAASSPFGVYVLSFINYFTISSLYVLLNFPIPEHIYDFFSLLYQQINTPVFELFGFTPYIPPLSDQRVHSKRGIHFGVQSDLQSGQFETFLLLVGNIGLIFLLTWLLSFLKKTNVVRRMVSQEKWNMIFGHIINIIMPLTLPWTFMMLDSGVRNFKTKLNAGCYLILYFVGVFFPIYYFFDLLQERQLELIKERNIRRKERQIKKQEQIKSLKSSKSRKKDEKNGATTTNLKKQIKDTKNDVKSTKMKKQSKQKSSTQKKQKKQDLSKTQKQKKSILKTKAMKRKVNIEKKKQQEEPRLQLSDLFSFEIAEQWYLCQANFLYPCLVLLQNPIIFLIVLQLFSLLGVIISFKKKQMRINSTILALYPFIFHVCFMIFYFSSSLSVLVITEMVCLATYLLGLFHHVITLFYEIIVFFMHVYQKCQTKNSITPKSTQKKKDKESKSKSKKKRQQKSGVQDNKKSRFEIRIDDAQILRELDQKKVVLPFKLNRSRKEGKKDDDKRLKVNLQK